MKSGVLEDATRFLGEMDDLLLDNSKNVQAKAAFERLFENSDFEDFADLWVRKEDGDLDPDEPTMPIGLATVQDLSGHPDRRAYHYQNHHGAQYGYYNADPWFIGPRYFGDVLDRDPIEREDEAFSPLFRYCRSNWDALAYQYAVTGEEIVRTRNGYNTMREFRHAGDFPPHEMPSTKFWDMVANYEEALNGQ